MSRRKLEITNKYNIYEELEASYKDCNDAKLRTRMLAVLQTWDGKPSLEVAKDIHMADTNVRKWVHRFNELGIAGLIDTRRSNRASYLSSEQKQSVIDALQKSPRECGYNKSNWTMPLLKKWISKQWGINYKASSLYDLVHKLGFTLQRPKKQSRNAKKDLQEQYKEELQDLLVKPDDDTVILYEDETIFTDEPTTTLKWSRKGKQPIIPTDSSGSRERIVMFGAVDPTNGKVHYSTSEAGNTDSFKDFLK
jgi:transposase